MYGLCYFYKFFYKYIKTLFLFCLVAYRLSCRTKYETISRLTIRPISHRLLSLVCASTARSATLVRRDPTISCVFDSLLCQKDVATSFAILLTNFCGKVSRNSVRRDAFMEIVSPLSCKFPLQPRYDGITRCRSNFATTTLHIKHSACISYRKHRSLYMECIIIM